MLVELSSHGRTVDALRRSSIVFSDLSTMLAGTLGSAPFDFMRRPATKYDVFKYAGLICFMKKDVENDTPNDTPNISSS